MRWKSILLCERIHRRRKLRVAPRRVSSSLSAFVPERQRKASVREQNLDPPCVLHRLWAVTRRSIDDTLSALNCVQAACFLVCRVHRDCSPSARVEGNC